jgi:hypothetical protein
MACSNTGTRWRRARWRSQRHFRVGAWHAAAVAELACCCCCYGHSTLAAWHLPHLFDEQLHSCSCSCVTVTCGYSRYPQCHSRATHWWHQQALVHMYTNCSISPPSTCRSCYTSLLSSLSYACRLFVSASYPFDTMKVRLQASDGVYEGMADCFTHIWRTEGVSDTITRQNDYMT